MKNIVLALVLIFACSNLFAQDTVNNRQGDASEMFRKINQAGINLNKGGSLGYTAVLFEVVGTVIMLIPDQEGVHSPQETMYFGAAIILSGIVIHVISYSKLMKAGRLLEGVRPSGQGVGISIPIK